MNGCATSYLLAAGVLWGAPAWALDPDIAFHVQSRRLEVAPLCPALLADDARPSSPQLYAKALCWLYGVGGPAREEPALDLLRQLAPANVEAQLALADALQQGSAVQQQEALQWYGRATAAGDVRASVRQARLQQRVQAATAQDAAPAGDDADPFADPLTGGTARPPGYHCHVYGLGKKVCHSSMVD